VAMVNQKIRAKFKKFALPPMSPQNFSIVIPTIKGTPALKYGQHAYYFLNFRTLKGLLVTISHKDIIKVGLRRFKRTVGNRHKFLPNVRYLFKKYQSGFNFLEQIMLMTVPHTVTYIGNSRFIINLWAYYGYLVIDCRKKTAEYKVLEEDEDDHVLGSQQWFDPDTKELYCMSYSLKDTFKRFTNLDQKVSFRIFKHENRTDETREIWQGSFADFPHDILINRNRQYCVVPELGMHKDKKGNLIPSKVIVLDLKNNKQWMISRFLVAAHAQFDPEDADIIYFSNHNFEFQHTNLIKLLKNAIYGIKFKGPASIYKYRLTQEGPKELGVFTKPDFFRLTNFHVFNHRGQKIIAAIGSPNYIFIIDANSMQFVKKIEVKHLKKIKNSYRNIQCGVGTISPSLDGEKIFVHTARSFQIVDIASSRADMILDHYFNHSCSNHMLTSTDTSW
jgi:hypothetical protein